MTQTPTPALAILDHDEWERALVFTGATDDEAQDAAERWLLEETAEYRDPDLYLNEGEEDTDQRWLDVCLSEGWSIRVADPAPRT